MFLWGWRRKISKHNNVFKLGKKVEDVEPSKMGRTAAALYGWSVRIRQYSAVFAGRPKFGCSMEIVGGRMSCFDMGL